MMKSAIALTFVALASAKRLGKRKGGSGNVDYFVCVANEVEDFREAIEAGEVFGKMRFAVSEPQEREDGEIDMGCAWGGATFFNLTPGNDYKVIAWGDVNSQIGDVFQSSENRVNRGGWRGKLDEDERPQGGEEFCLYDMTNDEEVECCTVEPYERDMKLLL